MGLELRLAFDIVLGAILGIALALGAAPTEAAETYDDALRDWERRMVEYGQASGDYLASRSDYAERLNATYYDAHWIFQRIARYTGDDEPWLGYARVAEDVYRRYLAENDFQAAGWMQFPHGLYLDWERTGDERSRKYLLGLRDNAAFSNPLRPIADGWYQQRRSREVAYSLETQVLAEKAGAPRRSERLNRFVDMALTHIESWTTGQYRASERKRQYCQAFMAGLTASALISYYEHTIELGNPDERIPAAVRTLADWLWQEMWVGNVDGTGYGAFEYVQPAVEGTGSNEPAPDLNMLIVPMYGWLYYRTGETEYRDRGDAIFAGGVELANLGVGKRFNQNYRSSFDYVRWRRAGESGS